MRIKPATAKKLALQNQLNLVFTPLLLVGTVILSVFLNISIDAIRYNTESHTIYNEARQLYHAKGYLQRFEVALNVYELTGSVEALNEYNASYAQLTEFLTNVAKSSQDAGEKQALEQIIRDLRKLRRKFDAVIDAVDRHDDPQVIVLDEDAYTLVRPIFAQIDALIGVRRTALDSLRREVRSFSDMGRLIVWVTLPAFVLLVMWVTWIVARQIYVPLLTMNACLKEVRDRKFNPVELGDLPQRSNEIGYLAREFIQMAAALRSSHTRMRQEIKEIRSKFRA